MIDNKQRDRNDIYGIPVLKTIFKNQKFIMAVRILTLAIFVYGIYLGFTDDTKENSFGDCFGLCLLLFHWSLLDVFFVVFVHMVF